MSILGKVLDVFLKDKFGEWMKSASEDQLREAYEEERLKYYVNTGEKTHEMMRINDELLKRSSEKWKSNAHRSKDPNYRWTDANRWEKE